MLYKYITKYINLVLIKFYVAFNLLTCTDSLIN